MGDEGVGVLMSEPGVEYAVRAWGGADPERPSSEVATAGLATPVQLPSTGCRIAPTASCRPAVAAQERAPERARPSDFFPFLRRSPPPVPAGGVVAVELLGLEEAEPAARRAVAASILRVWRFRLSS
jgi:hypothetical protein